MAAGSQNSIFMLISLIVAVLLFLMKKPTSPKSSSSSSSSPTSSSTAVESQSIARAQAPSVVKREVTCEECLKPKESKNTIVTDTTKKCDDCLVKPGMECLKQHFDSKNVRAVSWKDLFNRMNEISEKVVNIVELGTSPLGQKSCIDTGCSTVLFGQWVKNRNELYNSRKNVSMARLYSVDNQAEKIKQAKTTYEKYPEIIKNIQFSHHEKMVDFITSFDKQIDILYIDSNGNSNSIDNKRAHLAEIRAALPKLSKHAMVVIDNIKLGHGDLVIQELATKGFKILSDDFQAIITKPVITDSVKNEISRMSEWMAESKKL